MITITFGVMTNPDSVAGDDAILNLMNMDGIIQEVEDAISEVLERYSDPDYATISVLKQ